MDFWDLATLTCFYGNTELQISKISEINQAYDVLSDDKKRKDYDKNLKKIQIDKSFQFDDDEI